MSHAQRLGMYQSLTGVAASLLGFFIATVSILLGLIDSTKPRLEKALSGGNRERVQSFFFAGITASSGMLILFVVMGFADRGAEISQIVEIGLLAMLGIVGLATGRIVWVLRQVVLIANRVE